MLASNSKLGPYEIIGSLGSGGMGEVYRARDTRLGRHVAIKTLPLSMARDPEAVARFEREAKALAALAHPNIVAIHEFDTVDDVSFFVMELLEGETIASRLDRGPIPWREVIDIAIDAAKGLAAAHERGIVHRDLKPANIFITRDEQVKVLDFGIARTDFHVSSGTDTTEPLRTNPGAVLGTVGYLAPEVLRGSTADMQSDVFSLGCVLFEMVTGKRAFLRDTPMATFAAILTDDLSFASNLPEGMPPQVGAIVQRAVAKNPAERFGSMRDLLTALRTLQSTTHVSGIVPMETKPRAIAPIVASVIVIATIVGVWVWRERSTTDRPTAYAPRIRSIAVLPFENASGDPELEYLSDGLTEDLINTLSRMPSLRVVARTSSFRYKGTKLDPRAIGRDLEADALVIGRVVARDGQLIVQSDLLDVPAGSQLWGQRYQMPITDTMRLQEQLERQISQQLRLRIGGVESGAVHRAQTTDDEAYRLYLKGRFYWNKRTEEGYQKAISYFEQALARDPNFALAYSGIADAYVLSYSLTEAETMKRAKDAARKALAIDESLAEAHTSLGHVLHYFDWDFAGAEREFRRAIDLNPNFAQAHHWFGRDLVQTGRHEEGIAEVERALDLDPLSLIINTDYGYVLFIGGRYDAAIEQFKKTFELDPTFVRPRVYAAWTYREKGDYANARKEALKAIELAGRTADTLATLGAVEFAAGDLVTANKIRDEVVSMAKDRYVAPLFMLQLFLARGEADEALAWLRKAEREKERSSMLDVANEPVSARYRSDPRFAAIFPRR